MTEEEIGIKISATMDSVDLIEKLNSKEGKTQDDLDSINRNIEHLKIVSGTDLIKLFNKNQLKRINTLIK